MTGSTKPFNERVIDSPDDPFLNHHNYYIRSPLFYKSVTLIVALNTPS